jgi:hypothetical protein
VGRDNIFSALSTFQQAPAILRKGSYSGLWTEGRMIVDTSAVVASAFKEPMFKSLVDKLD